MLGITVGILHIHTIMLDITVSSLHIHTIMSYEHELVEVQ